jgi:hypothetical protein
VYPGSPAAARGSGTALVTVGQASACPLWQATAWSQPPDRLCSRIPPAPPRVHSLRRGAAILCGSDHACCLDGLLGPSPAAHTRSPAALPGTLSRFRGASPCLRERRSRHCTWPKGLCGLRQRQIGEDTLPISLAEATRNSENWGLVESPHCAGSRRPPDTHTPEGGRTFVRPNAPVAANAALERFAVALSSRSVGRDAG